MTRDDDRFVEIYETYRNHIRAYCTRRTARDAVDDAVADTFLTAWRRIDDVPGGESALLWLYGVAYKVLGHQWRGASRRKRLNSRLQTLAPIPSSGPEEVIVVRHESLQMRQALGRLNGTDREILLLAAWEGLDHAEMATVLGITPGAVRQRFYQARKNLTREYARLDKSRMRSPAAQEGGAW